MIITILPPTPATTKKKERNCHTDPIALAWCAYISFHGLPLEEPGREVVARWTFGQSNRPGHESTSAAQPAPASWSHACVGHAPRPYAGRPQRAAVCGVHATTRAPRELGQLANGVGRPASTRCSQWWNRVFPNSTTSKDFLYKIR